MKVASPEQHQIIMVPGLSDDVWAMSVFAKYWEVRFGIPVQVHKMGWLDGSTDLQFKHEQLLSTIDHYLQLVEFVHLVGISAGGPAAVNAAFERSNIFSVVTVCSRLAEGENVFPSLKKAGKKSPTFIESVRKAESNIKNAKADFLKKIMTIRPKYGDGVVPPSTASIEGATNVEIPTYGHMASIGYVLMFPGKIINFLSNM